MVFTCFTMGVCTCFQNHVILPGVCAHDCQTVQFYIGFCTCCIMFDTYFGKPTTLVRFCAYYWQRVQVYIGFHICSNMISHVSQHLGFCTLFRKPFILPWPCAHDKQNVQVYIGFCTFCVMFDTCFSKHVILLWFCAQY